jgi:hypothetical protein
MSREPDSIDSISSGRTHTQKKILEMVRPTHSSLYTVQKSRAGGASPHELAWTFFSFGALLYEMAARVAASPQQRSSVAFSTSNRAPLRAQTGDSAQAGGPNPPTV